MCNATFVNYISKVFVSIVAVSNTPAYLNGASVTAQGERVSLARASFF